MQIIPNQTSEMFVAISLPAIPTIVAQITRSFTMKCQPLRMLLKAKKSQCRIIKIGALLLFERGAHPNSVEIVELHVHVCKMPTSSEPVFVYPMHKRLGTRVASTSSHQSGAA
jgi:hypothetical protein